MSIISEQIRRIRTMEKIIQHNGIKLLLTEAANTIEALSAKLAVANMERSEVDYGGGWIMAVGGLHARIGCQNSQWKLQMT